LKALTGGVVSIAGAATDPSSVTLNGRVALTRGDVLSLPPNAMLPDGLLSTVLGISYASGDTSVSVAAASVYEVAPNFQFDAPLAEQSPATVADVQAGCGGVSGVLPYVTIKDVLVLWRLGHREGIWPAHHRWRPGRSAFHSGRGRQRYGRRRPLVLAQRVVLGEWDGRSRSR